MNISKGLASWSGVVGAIAGFLLAVATFMETFDALDPLAGLGPLLAAQPDVPHPPLVFVARPDEEVGRHEAVVALAALFAERGVRFGYTVDGITQTRGITRLLVGSEAQVCRSEDATAD